MKSHPEPLEHGAVFAFEDSEVAGVEIGSDIVLRFSAAHVTLPAGPAASAGLVEGYMRSVALICTGASREGIDPACIGRIASGHLGMRGQRLRQLPLPFSSHAKVTLELAFANGDELRLDAAGAAIVLGDDARFSEAMSC